VTPRALLLTALAMTAFALNSVLCRLALRPGSIDAASFTTIRFVSGALVLGAIALMRRPRPRLRDLGSVRAALALFLYAITFSYAYLSLAAGTGALILFGTVQVTMITSGLWSGERPRPLQWVGVACALAGLVYLVFPGVAAPSLSGAVFMTIAGIAWGVYSLYGRSSKDPTLSNAGNFLFTVPLVLLASAVTFPSAHAEPRGVLYAAISGAITSGLGYVIWYAALTHLTALRAATVQLSVPVIAAVLGVVFLEESASLRLIAAGIAILGGIAMALGLRSKRRG
jgi:drug/metabolite transporter (DMT)-like permease